MLNLTRHAGQTICIGDDIRIVVISIKRNRVCLGVEAPLEIFVHRSEIYDRIQDKKEGGVNLEIDNDFDDVL